MKNKRKLSANNRGLDKVAAFIVGAICFVQIKFASTMTKFSSRLTLRQLKVTVVLVSAAMICFSGAIIYQSTLGGNNADKFPVIEQIELPSIRDELYTNVNNDTALLNKLRRRLDTLYSKQLESDSTANVLSPQQLKIWMDSVELLRQIILSNSK